MNNAPTINPNVADISDERAILLGSAIVKAFRLKPNYHGDYRFSNTNVSLLGLGRSIILTVEDSTNLPIKELNRFLNTAYPS